MFPPATGAGELPEFVSACVFLTAVCRGLVLDIAERTTDAAARSSITGLQSCFARMEQLKCKAVFFMGRPFAGARSLLVSWPGQAITGAGIRLTDWRASRDRIPQVST